MDGSCKKKMLNEKVFSVCEGSSTKIKQKKKHRVKDEENGTEDNKERTGKRKSADQNELAANGRRKRQKIQCDEQTLSTTLHASPESAVKPGLQCETRCGDNSFFSNFSVNTAVDSNEGHQKKRKSKTSRHCQNDVSDSSPLLEQKSDKSSCQAENDSGPDLISATNTKLMKKHKKRKHEPCNDTVGIKQHSEETGCKEHTCTSINEKTIPSTHKKRKSSEEKNLLDERIETVCPVPEDLVRVETDKMCKKQRKKCKDNHSKESRSPRELSESNAYCSNEGSTAQESVANTSKHKKHKKKSKHRDSHDDKETSMMSTLSIETASQEMQVGLHPDEVNCKKKKKKSKQRDSESVKNTIMSNCPSDQSEGQTLPANAGEREHKKKKKKSKNNNCVDLESNCVSNVPHDESVVSHDMNGEIGRKKKKKKSKHKSSDGTDVSGVPHEKIVFHGINGEKVNHSRQENKSKHKSPDGTDVLCASHEHSVSHDRNGELDEVNHKRRIRKKKSKHKSLDGSDVLLGNITPETSSQHEHIKTDDKKPMKAERSQDRDTDILESHSTSMPCTLSDKTVVQDSHADSHAKKHKKQKRKCKDMNDSVSTDVLSSVSNEKAADGTNLNCVTQSDSSGMEKAACIQGQWQGDLFGSDERQNKFLRLMGGMKKSSDNNGTDGERKKTLFTSQRQSGARKKGLFGSLASYPNGSGSVGGNSALSITAAASLDQRLEDEYNRAMNLKLNTKKGAGFGYTPDPAEGKSFHIDVNKSKSIVFDD